MRSLLHLVMIVSSVNGLWIRRGWEEDDYEEFSLEDGVGGESRMFNSRGPRSLYRGLAEDDSEAVMEFSDNYYDDFGPEQYSMQFFDFFDSS